MLIGGEWLLVSESATDILTPETLTEVQRMVAATSLEFVEQEVLPATEQLEKKDWTLARSLIARCGDLGLLGTDVPEALGGVGLDKVSSVIVAEAIGMAASFATTFGAQTSLAIVPLLYFGTQAQQEKYLPRLVSGELIGAYCLSESESGSDALSARTRATRAEDGSWRITGEKMWTTNGGFADLFVVFAKVDGERFSAFLVERGFAGVSSGAEEHKMGLHGSSTTPLILQDAVVPGDNLLGEIGRGHKIAFNVLNYGRFKLAAMCTGGAKLAIREAATYAVSRRQFGEPIASFGAIRHKLAEMTIRQYGVEGMLYRTAGLIDAAIAGGQAGAAALEEFAIEASLLKVAGSEMIDFAVDENVQIHGGNGFVCDYPAERHYRDARVNRIFEGTNEINRLLVPAMLMKRALKGRPAIIAAARQLQDDLLSPRASASVDASPLEAAAATVSGMKQTAIMVLGLALQTFGDKLQHEQELLMRAADVMLDTYAADSGLLRAQRAGAGTLHVDAATVLIHDAGLRTEAAARTVVASMTSGDTLKTMLAGLRRILKVAPVDTIAGRRRIADAVIEKKGYIFG